MKIKVLSIRQPWAWLILNAGKDLENRKWKTKFRGRFLIHAAKGMTKKEYEECKLWVIANIEYGLDLVRNKLPCYEQFERGGIVGEATIIDCIDIENGALGRRWFMGPYAFVLKDIKKLPFKPMKGMLGLFTKDIKKGDKLWHAADVGKEEKNSLNVKV